VLIEEGVAAPTLTFHWNQWLKVSFSVALPNGDPSSGGIILPKHHDMFPAVDVNCNIDFKHEGYSSEPVESCKEWGVRKRLCTQHHVAPSTQVDTIETAAK
jgi:hypothetical protein